MSYAAISTVLLVSFLAPLAGHIAGKGARKAWLSVLLVSLFLVLLNVVLAWLPSVEHKLKDVEFYASIHERWYVPFALIFFVTARLHVSTKLLGHLLLVLSAILMMLVSFTSVWLLFGDYSGLDGRIDRDGVCIQSTSYSCVAASSVTILHQLGMPATEAEMARLTFTVPLRGSSALKAYWALKRKAEGQGYRAELLTPGWEELKKLGAPCMVSMRYGFLVSHMTVVLAADEEKVILGDPLKGRWVMSARDFKADWYGDALVVRKE